MAISDVELSVGLVPGDIKKTAEEMGDAIKDVFDATAGMELNTQLKNIKKGLSDSLSDLDKLYNKADALESQILPTKEYEQLERQYAKLDDKLDSLSIDWEYLDKAVDKGVISMDQYLKKTGELAIKQEQVLEQMKATREEMEKMKEEGTAFIQGYDTDEYKNTLIDIADKNNQIRIQMERWNQAAGKETSGLGQISNSLQRSLQPLINFNQQISNITGTLKSAFGPYVQIAVGAVQLFIGVIKTAIKVLTKFAQLIAGTIKTVLTPFKLVMQATGKAIVGMFETIKSHTSTTLKNLLTTLIKYGIIMKALSWAINQVKSMSGDLLNQLAKQIPEVNSQMSAFQTALNGLKGSLATAFQPIVSAVLPALTTLINAVSRAISVVAKFIALLTGQQFVYEATATQVDYAKSLDKTGKSAKKAEKALKGYLSPLDEINKYESQKDDDTGGGGGAGADGGFTLKKVPIEDWIKDFWDRIRKAWQNADFFDLGKMLGDKLAEMLAKIPWRRIKNEARRLGKSLATLLNGFMKGEFQGTSLATYMGRTIAEAINTAFEFVSQYLKNFDFKDLGRFILEMIHGAFDTLDWNLIIETIELFGLRLGELVAKLFSDRSIFEEAGARLISLLNALVIMIYDFFNQQSVGDIGGAISGFLKKAIEGIQPNEWAATFNLVVTKILNSLIVAIRTTPWDELGVKLAQAFNEIDFEGIFAGATQLANSIINALLDCLEDFLDTMDDAKIEEIGTSLADTINDLDWQPERFGKLANRLLNALLDILLTAIDEIDFDQLGEKVRETLAQIDWTEKIQKAHEILDGISEGLKNLLKDALIGVFKGIGEDTMAGFRQGIIQELTSNPGAILHPFLTIIKAVKHAFGISSPSKVFEDIGDDIVQGFINGIKSIIDKAKEIWENLKTRTTEKYDEIKEKIVGAATNIKNDVIKAWEDLKSSTIEIFQGMWDGIKGIINTILAGIESLVNGVISGINGVADTLNHLQIDPPAWVKEKFGIGTIGFNLSHLGNISIPRLAQGAVIPPNKEFMAVLGDQSQGTNIETPLSTMIEAFNTALKQSGTTGKTEITFVLPDRRKIAQYVLEGGRIMQTSTGRNPFELA